MGSESAIKAAAVPLIFLAACGCLISYAVLSQSNTKAISRNYGSTSEILLNTTMLTSMSLG